MESAVKRPAPFEYSIVVSFAIAEVSEDVGEEATVVTDGVGAAGVMVADEETGGASFVVSGVALASVEDSTFSVFVDGLLTFPDVFAGPSAGTLACAREIGARQQAKTKTKVEREEKARRGIMGEENPENR